MKRWRLSATASIALAATGCGSSDSPTTGAPGAGGSYDDGGGGAGGSAGQGVGGMGGAGGGRDTPDAADANADASEDGTRADAGDARAEAFSDAVVDGPAPDADRWTPARLPGLALWLAADKGVAAAGTQVTTWMDQSGRGNHATQTVGERQPSLAQAALNELPVVRFDGVANALHVGEVPSLQFGTGDFAIEVVAAYTNDPASNQPYGLLVSKQSQVGPDFIGYGFWANYPLPAIDTTLALQIKATNAQDVKSSMRGINDGVPRLLGARRYGATSIEVRINGTVAGTKVIDSINVDTSGTFLFIGGQEKPTGVIQPLRGYIAEVVVVGGAMTPLELSDLESYLQTKYRL